MALNLTIIRTAHGAHRIYPIRGSAGLPEEEPRAE